MDTGIDTRYKTNRHKTRSHSVHGFSVLIPDTVGLDTSSNQPTSAWNPGDSSLSGVASGIFFSINRKVYPLCLSVFVFNSCRFCADLGKPCHIASLSNYIKNDLLNPPKEDFWTVQILESLP